MKNHIKRSCRAILFLLLIITVSGCGEMLDNPTIDKDTGEDITLLLVDFNFFTTRVSYKFIDAEDNSTITKSAKMWFTGTNADDIVDYGGEKNTEYITSAGQMELTVDPNLEISTASPMKYAVNVEIDGYLPFTKGIEITEEGLETFELLLIKQSSDEEDTLTGEEDGDDFVFSLVSETKSASTEEKPYTIEYRMSKSDMVKCLNANGQKIYDSVAAMMAAYRNYEGVFFELSYDPQEVANIDINSLNYEGDELMVLLEPLENYIITGLTLGGQIVSSFDGAELKQSVVHDEPEPDIFGFIESDNFNGFLYLGKNLVYTQTPFSYLLASASLDPICSTGASIEFLSAVESSFSFRAGIYDDEGTLISTKVFEGDFPETFTLTNMPAESAVIKFSNKNNPSFDSIPDLSIDNLCSDNYEVVVNAADDYNQYQIVLIAKCSESQVAVAPTYRGELQIKGSNEWQNVIMNSGKANILAKENEEYEIRILWKEDYETATFHTTFDANGEYINNTDFDITSEKIDENRTRIRIEHEFDQDICDDIDW